MTCAEFETAIAELLAEREPPAESAVARLRRHASSCASCAGAIDLVELAAMPAASRDPIADPGVAYWNGFDARLKDRIRDERRVFRKRAGITAAAAAAAAIAAIVTVGALRNTDPVRSGAEPPFLQETPRTASALPDASDIDDDPGLEFVGAEAVDPFDDDDAQLFPTVEGLTPDDAKRLLDWLAQEETKTKRGAA